MKTSRCSSRSASRWRISPPRASWIDARERRASERSSSSAARAMTALEPIPLAEIRAARERIESFVLRTPLVRLNVDDAPAEIHLKLENLQPIGSFKLRGAGNAMAAVDESEL